MPGRGERVGDAYVEIHANGDHIDEDIKKGFGKADKDVEEAGRRHNRKYGDGFADEEKRSKTLANSIRAAFGRMERNPALINSGKGLGKKLSEMISGEFDQHGVDDMVRSVGKLSLVSRRLGRDVDTSTVAIRESTKVSHGFFSSFKDGFTGIHRTTSELEGFRRKISLLDDKVDHYSDVAGRAFGRGARNDFINLFGAGVRGFALLANIVPKVTKALFFFKDGFTSIRQAMAGTEGGLSSLSAGAGAGAKAFGGLATAGIGLTAGLAALVILIGPLISLISGITAAVVALSGSLVFAAAAGVGVLAGALVPLIAGIGVLALGIFNLNSTAQKAMTAAIRPLSKELKGLTEVAGGVFAKALPQIVNELAPALSGLRPLVRGIAEALVDVGRNFANNLSSPAFETFKRDMAAFLPNAVRSLGFSLTNTFAGVGGVIRSLIPITNQFLGWLEKITQNFADWANSAKGQRELGEFFRNAADSAKSVGRFLREATVALSQLLSAGRSSGDNIFDDMANALRRFTSYLRANPNAVSNWFANGVAVARDIGHGIEGIAAAFKALDSGTNRTILQAVFKGVGFLAKGAGIEILLVTAYMRVFSGVIGAVAFGLGKTLEGIGKLTHSDGLESFGKNLAGIGSDMLDFAAHGAKAEKGADSMAKGISNANQQAEELRATLDQTTGAATRATRAFLLNQLQTSGAAQAANAYGISNRDLISATLGNAGAIDRVNAALSHAGPAANRIQNELAALGVQFDASGKVIRKNEADLTTWKEALSGIKNKDVRVAIRETGMEPTITKFKRLIETQHLTPRQVRIAAKALNVDLTKGQLQALINLSKGLGRQKPTVVPKVDHKPADKSIATITRGLHDVDHQTANPKITTNPNPVLNTVSRVLSRFGVVDRTHADPKVTAHVNGEGAISNIINLINRVHDKIVDVTVRHHETKVGANQATASGGRFNIPQIREIAEAGPEAVVPLNRPLGQVDPSVRWLSAIAQGLAPPTAAGGVFGAGRTVNIQQLQMVSASPDPRAAAAEFVNKLTSVMYA